MTGSVQLIHITLAVQVMAGQWLMRGTNGGATRYRLPAMSRITSAIPVILRDAQCLCERVIDDLCPFAA